MPKIGCLVELHSVFVEIDKFSGASNQIYGEILVLDRGPDLFHIFKEEKDSAKSISTDGTLPLVGLRQCIVGPGFFIKVSLKEKNHGLEICDGFINIPRSMAESYYDKHIRMTITGEHGYVVLHWMMFKYAVQATIEAGLFIKGDMGSHKPAISGQFVALYRENEYEDEFQRKYFQTMLLSEPQDEPKGLEVALDEKPMNSNHNGQKFIIPLSRVVVAVPTKDKSLFIKANLSISFPGTSTQSVNVGDTLSFAVETSNRTSSQSIIEFEYGYIEVKVSWLQGVLDERRMNWKMKNHISKSKGKTDELEDEELY